ncbi:MAG: sulfotransferase [Rudaea sp.]|uniref:tetratricopeptide repeat-containing sulfotransferase family protein n=1 Tax=Rudaea sp. TaxID=2136325 RepID=UPI0039E2628C
MNRSDPSPLRRADALLAQGKRREAIAAYRQALEVAPAAADGWFNLGYALRQEGEFEPALEAYAQALRHGVRGAQEVHLNRAAIYSDHLRRDDAAEAELRRALEIAPDYAPALLNLGNLHEERGQREQALLCYERILASQRTASPSGHEALARAAQLHRPAGVDDALLERVRRVAESDATIDDGLRANLFFVLGTALDGLGEQTRAFAAFESGKRFAHRRHAPYDAKRAERRTRALIDAFPRAEAGAPDDAAGKKPAPLFIVGMFRSGSTLVEQVLGAHPDVATGGELDILPRMVATELAPFPGSVATLDAARCAELAGLYRTRLPAALREQAAGKAWLTDKRPDNYALLGLVKRLFPNAKIVHSVRNPLDNALSVFMQHLNPRVFDYAGSLAGIGHHYGEYRRLMAHWKALYPDDICDFDYDAFVAQPQATLRALLDFLGLEWNEQCLRFHRRDNTVKTASYWQVRRPLYGDASGRWQRYRAFLDPLFAALDAAGVEYPG